jgi:small subunit ribosomal protein S2
MRRDLDKLSKVLGGVKFMRRMPQAMILASVTNEKIALAEAKLQKVPVIGIVDTNADPASVNIPILANDDSNKGVALILTLLGDAIATANKNQALAAYKDEPVIEGLIDREKRHNNRPNNRFNNRFNNNRQNYNRTDRKPNTTAKKTETTKKPVVKKEEK